MAKAISQSDTEWAVMVYLAGNNDLAEESVWSLLEMQHAFEAAAQNGAAEAPKGTVSVFAQFDSPLTGDLEQRVSFTSDNPKPVREADANTRGQSYRRILRNFICEGLKKHRPDHSMLVLSGHSSGIEGNLLRTGARVLTIPELRQVFDDDDPDNLFQSLKETPGLEKNGKRWKLDILGLDSCLMSMAEVAFELKDQVRILIGAEGFEMNTGWPYREILTRLLSRRRGETPRDLAAAFVGEYIDYYKHYVLAGQSADLAACDLSQCEAVKRAVSRLAAEMLRHLPARREIEQYQERLRQFEMKSDQRNGKAAKPGSLRGLEIPPGVRFMNAVILAHWEAQTFKDDQYTDISDFCSVLQRQLLETGYQPAAGLWERCDEVTHAVRKMVISSCYSGPAVQYSRGLSLFFPWSARVWNEFAADYQQLRFAQRNKWCEFIERYVGVTRRPVRCTCPHSQGSHSEAESFPVSSAEGTHEHRDTYPYTRDTYPYNRDPYPYNRDVYPYNRDTYPYNRMLSNSAASMKNYPTAYCNCSCRTRNGKEPDHLQKE